MSIAVDWLHIAIRWYSHRAAIEQPQVSSRDSYLLRAIGGRMKSSFIRLTLNKFVWNFLFKQKFVRNSVLLHKLFIVMTSGATAAHSADLYFPLIYFHCCHRYHRFQPMSNNL